MRGMKMKLSPVAVLIAVGAIAIMTGKCPAEAKAVPVATPGSLKPALSLQKALQLAEQYVRDNRIDVSGQHISSAQLRFDSGAIHKAGFYWHIQWLWDKPALGMEYGLYVYMDGSIFEHRSGP